ncbi:hypothetical protein ABVT39_002759 [Epinephelus coioides]
MAQFIHLLLLLGMCHVAATYVLERQVWLLEGSSATFPFPSRRTIKYCGRGGSKCQCVSGRCKPNNASLPSVTVTDSNLTITNFTRENDEINLCYDTPKNECVHLNVSIAPVNSTSVPPGPTRPQHSDEEEEEEGLLFYQKHKSWIDALQHCHNKNSALVQITNQRVQDAVNSFLQNKSGLDGGVWIGLERSIFGVNVPWQWISGERVKETQWRSSTFVDPLNNHCGKVIQVEGSQEFKWLDEDCHKELPFICQEAMAQFIHLLLLLGMCHVAATAHNERQVWLLEGSSATFPFPTVPVGRTIKYCGRGGSKCECESNKCKSNNASLPSVTVTDSNLTITNFRRENDEINLCYDSPANHQCVHLNVSIGCSESHKYTFTKGQPKHKVTTVADCRRLCTEDPTCQYFTFYTDNTTCFLMTSRDDMLIQLHSYAVSGYPARDDCAPVNPTLVPPGSNPPQPSHEEEEGLRFYLEHKSWIDALQHCHNKNSALVQIKNQTMQDAVKSVLKNESSLDGGVWIGLERSIFGVNVPWQWISGERVKEPHWSSSAFVDPLNNHCGKIIQVEGSQEFKWLDEDCHKELPFICQEAMAQFIHFLLQLLGMCHVAATYVYERQVWLLEGSSATFPFPSLRTIKYCGRGGSKCQCVSGRCESNNASLPNVTVTDSNLTITNFTRENDEINLCYDTLKNDCVHLNVSVGCSESHHITFAKGQPKHKVMTVADCRRLCTEDPTCQYFTFYKPNTACFLMTSRDNMLIQLHSYAVSGNNCAPVNSTSVPPGPTRPQHSDEEEEEEGLLFYQKHKSWIDALQHCHNKNSALVQITNQTVQDAVNSFLQNKSGLDGGVWIGLERSIFGVNVPWQWISGERVKETQWSSRTFVDPLNNHCGKVIQVEGSQEFKWLDEDCHKELPFICQDLNGKTSP